VDLSSLNGGVCGGYEDFKFERELADEVIEIPPEDEPQAAQ